MTKLISLLLYLLFFVLHFSFADESVSQKPLTTWQEQLDYMKNGADAADLCLINYTYKGVIKSELDKTKVIDSLFSDDSPIVLNSPPVIEIDTITLDSNSYEIVEKKVPKFEIILISKVAEESRLKGEENPFIKIKQQFETVIKIGFEVVELEWSYNGKTYHSISIVSNENGGVLYDHIGSNIHTHVSTTTMTRGKTPCDTLE